MFIAVMIEPQCNLTILIAVPNLNICTREKKNVILSEYHILFKKTERKRREKEEEERTGRLTGQSVSFLIGSKWFTWWDTRQRCSTKIYRLYFLTVLVFRKTWLPL